ncbi:MAG: hypothetical protein QOG63_1259 [Thermoleophilaceae bacterium]|nr:hypothetical protein [Thermoleophilaceae bacterium]
MRQPDGIDFEAREHVLRADFDLLDDDSCIWVSTRFMRELRAPREGEVVYLLDGRGCGCTGIVTSIEGHYACVKPDWSTFTGGPLPASVRG